MPSYPPPPPPPPPPHPHPLQPLVVSQQINPNARDRRESGDAKTMGNSNNSLDSAVNAATDGNSSGAAGGFDSARSPLTSARDKPRAGSNALLEANIRKLAPIESGIDLAAMGEQLDKKEKELPV